MDSENRSDTILVAKAAQGDHAAFAMLVVRYREKLHRLIYFMVHHQEDTLDLLQDTFLKAYENLPRLQKPEIFVSWLSKIAINLAINHVKRRARWRKCQDKLWENSKAEDIESPDSTLEEQENHAMLRSVIMELPPKQRSVLVLCDMEGHSYKETAEILQCRIGTVMSRLFYARNFLRSRLQNCQAVSVWGLRDEKNCADSAH
jgi:RNA polymerase sigma-70 factor (ECF subfamily)